MNMQMFEGNWDREYVKNHPDCLFIFTDNTNRNSGKKKIDPNSWYAKKYGIDKHYPGITSACIRGLDNAYPISTQHYYTKKKKGINGRWEDKDFNEFKTVIYDEINDIVDAWRTGKYKVVYTPNGGFFNRSISNISKERTPNLYWYMMDKLTFIYKQIE